jgi:CRISPR/Cas system-associated exonuclease Cas4 (RecB family)
MLQEDEILVTQEEGMLSLLNKHERDKFITFEEGPHIYTVNGERGTYTSVTTWIHKHFSKFNADLIIDKMMKSKNILDPKNKYFGMSKNEIKEMWDKKRDFSANAGTSMHYDIECYYNGKEVNNDSVEFKYFKNFIIDYPELKPYRTEWMIFHEDIKLSGSIDMIFENEDGSIQIYDWKRCENIVHDNSFDQFAITPGILHLPDTNYWHYALQLNTYRKILEDKYGKKVTNLCLVCLHPNKENYQRIEVPFLDEEMTTLFSQRIQEISNKNTNHIPPSHPPPPPPSNSLQNKKGNLMLDISTLIF